MSCHLSVLCVVRYRSLCRADPSSRGVISSVVCLCDRTPQRWEGLGPLVLSSLWWVEANIPLYMDHLYSIHKRQTSMHTAGFEHKIPVSERPQTHATKGIGPVNSPGSHKTNRTKRNVMFQWTSLLFRIPQGPGWNPGPETGLLTYSMEQSPSWKANWFCS